VHLLGFSLAPSWHHPGSIWSLGCTLVSRLMYGTHHVCYLVGFGPVGTACVSGAPCVTGVPGPCHLGGLLGCILVLVGCPLGVQLGSVYVPWFQLDLFLASCMKWNPACVTGVGTACASWAPCVTGAPGPCHLGYCPDGIVLLSGCPWEVHLGSVCAPTGLQLGPHHLGSILPLGCTWFHQ